MTHEECRLLLPWLANGTLAGQELESAGAHVASCEGCRSELSALRQMSAAERRIGEEMPARPVRLGPMMARIEEAETPWWRRVTVLRWAMAGQLAMILLLAGMMLERDAGFVTQSGGETPDLRIAVIFQQDATAQTIRELLFEVGAKIVDGPAYAGLYTLSFPEVKSDDLAKADELLKRLRSRTRVVSSAERKAP